MKCFCISHWIFPSMLSSTAMNWKTCKKTNELSISYRKLVFFQIILSVQTCIVSKPYPGLRSACVWQQTRHTIIIPASNKEPSTYHFILYPPLLWLIDLPASISLFLLLDKKEKQIRRKQSWYGRNPVNPSTNQMGKKLGYHIKNLGWKHKP